MTNDYLVKTYDFVVAGAGVAGIAISELLQRSGKKVLLLESEDTLATAASAQQQGWFHTGALYAALPSKKSFELLAINAQILLKYYSGFPGMNFARAQPVSTSNNGGWFNPDSVHYFYVRPTESEISYWKKPLWYFATLMARSRMGRLEAMNLFCDSRDQIETGMAHGHLKNVSETNYPESLSATSALSFVSPDRSINSTRMLDDLVKSFLASGGEIRLNAKAVKIEKNKVFVREGTKGDTREDVFEGQHVLLTSGRQIKELDPGRNTITVVKSPLLVVAPALFDVNFVRLSVDRANIITHIRHTIAEGSYSVIGNATYHGADQVIDSDSLKSDMLDNVSTLLGTTISARNSCMYFGYKTEILGKHQTRNYQYHFLQSDRADLALPGKLSLAFSLAVDCCRRYGIHPSIRIPSLNGEHRYPISRPVHAMAAAKIYEGIE